MQGFDSTGLARHNPYMSTFTIELTRRQALAGIGATSALALAGCKTTAAATTTGPDQWLETVGYNLLAHEPERATGLGVDVGPYAGLRSKLEDQSISGQRAYAATLRADLATTRAFPRAGMTADQLTSFEVVESAYATALDGFALPIARQVPKPESACTTPPVPVTASTYSTIPHWQYGDRRSWQARPSVRFRPGSPRR